MSGSRRILTVVSSDVVSNLLQYGPAAVTAVLGFAAGQLNFGHRRKLAKDIEILAELQKLDGNDLSKAMMEDVIRSRVVSFKSSAETTREMRLVLYYGAMVVFSLMIVASAYVVRGVFEPGEDDTAFVLMLTFGIGAFLFNSYQLLQAALQLRRDDKAASDMYQPSPAVARYLKTQIEQAQADVDQRKDRTTETGSAP